jgi:DNA topoisomerase-2
VIEDPSFSSQTKGELTTKVSNYGSTCELSNEFITKVFNTGLADWITKLAQFKELSGLKQTDGKKVTSLRDIPKLDDAHWAGTRRSKETRLILTEGDSAKAFATTGIKLMGRDKFGVFPLRGKLLNVRNATAEQIKKNKEFIHLKKILGLKQDVKYKDVGKLRYGGIIILTDQDADGSHIKGLIINMFQYFWPDLLKIDDFIQTMSTPLLKAFKKGVKKNNEVITFYTISEFEKWSHEVNMGQWNIKYYKGLGTSDEKEAREVFRDFENRIIGFVWEKVDGGSETKKLIKDKHSDSDGSDESDKDDKDDKDDEDSEDDSDSSDDEDEKSKGSTFDKTIYGSKSYESITLAFDEKRANDRKIWLGKYDKDDILEYTNKNVTYTAFIDKELIHFSNGDNIRSLPSIVDGFKPSHRKILYAMFKKNQKTDIKVAQLASYVAEHTAYKHGENSLQEAIIGMAQNFPGSNNIYLLFPQGNFGYRRQGGDEHSSPRYIFTRIDPITFKIFIPQDDSILNYQIDEGESIEPEYYYPIIPMILVNGSKGIGTGFSTNIPQYNPLDICDNIYKIMDGKKLKEMTPWYYGFTGAIDKVGDAKYKITGKYEIKGISEIHISEIPIRGNLCWTENYEEFLNTLVDDNVVVKKPKDKDAGLRNKKAVAKKVEDIISNCGNNEIDFTIKMKGTELQQIIKQSDDDELEKYFKLSANMSVSNLYLYNSDGVITKYDTPLDIIEEFYEFRLEMYAKRKKYYLRILANELLILKNKVRYIQDNIDKKIVVMENKREDVMDKIVKRGYPKLSTKFNATEEEKTYNYLTSMMQFSFTIEKIKELNKEYDDKKKEYDEYSIITELELWRRELDDFVAFYKIWLKERDEYDADGDKKPKKGKGGATTKPKPKGKGKSE